VPSVADEPALAPGVNAIALTYDYALRENLAPLMRSGEVNRMLAVPRSTDDLVNKLEAVRLVCQQTGCAQRYLVGDAMAAIASATHDMQGDYAQRFAHYLQQVHNEDLAVGIAMTDGKGDRSLRAPRPSSPARRTCITCWSCPAAT
jgi:4-hydroxybutyryl-CoA dehydratase/vinylacetyl-CoA-Delta-isomerase